MTPGWTRYPPITLRSPVLAVLAGPGGLWAAGLGGIARYDDERGWNPPVTGLPLRSVSALAAAANVLLAGGDGGIVRSEDAGHTWSRCAIPSDIGPITAISPSPNVAQDGTVLAATLAGGIVRSTDTGRTWQRSSFGLPSQEVLAVAWGTGETVVAATAAGLARSPNAGRAWRPCPGTEGTVFTALATLRDGTMLAAPDTGQPLRSTGDHTIWTRLSGPPDDIQPSALAATTDGAALLGTTHGIWRSDDGGATWTTVSDVPTLSLSASATHVSAGTTTGVSRSSDGGQTWEVLPTPPLHDLRRLLIVDGAPLVAGTNSQPVIADHDGGWTPLATAPLPLIGLFTAPDGAIFGSSPDGLYRSADRGASWTPVLPGGDGSVTQMSFLPDGAGWAGLAADGALLRTGDSGQTWERLSAPFGVLPLVALQAVPGPSASTPSLTAATYDERQQAVALWRSDDGGEHWRRGGDSFTPWPVVATSGAPPLVTIGATITVQQPDGTWRQSTVGQTGVRRVVSAGATLHALTGDGIWRSDNLGATWEHDDADLPADQIVDIALAAGIRYVLLVGGHLWSRPL